MSAKKLRDKKELQFKYRFVARGGQPKGLFASQGKVDDREILLDKDTLSCSDIIDSTTRDTRLILLLREGASLEGKIANNLLDGKSIILEIQGNDTREVELFIDRLSSKHAAKRHQEALEAEGQGHQFHSVECPECGSTIDLSLLDRSPFVYCRYCESVFQGHRVATAGDRYRHCDECNMFNRVQGYTEFYFYFLLVVYGFYYKRRHLCDSCAGTVFWKMFFLNFIFVIGLFPTIWLKIKSLQGRDPKLQKLTQANDLARQGKYKEANALLTRLQNKIGNHPGLLFNRTMGHLNGKDGTGAVAALQNSLQSCSNYAPSVRLAGWLQEASQQSQQQES